MSIKIKRTASKMTMYLSGDVEQQQHHGREHQRDDEAHELELRLAPVQPVEQLLDRAADQVEDVVFEAARVRRPLRAASTEQAQAMVSQATLPAESMGQHKTRTAMEQQGSAMRAACLRGRNTCK